MPEKIRVEYFGKYHIYRNSLRNTNPWVLADGSGVLYYRKTREEVISLIPEERSKTMINKLKELVVAKYQIEELIELRAQARVIYEEYTTQKLDTPDWLSNAINDLDREISARARDERMHRLSELRAKRSNLRTIDEKRADVDREIAGLEEALGAKVSSAPGQN